MHSKEDHAALNPFNNNHHRSMTTKFINTLKKHQSVKADRMASHGLVIPLDGANR